MIKANELRRGNMFYARQKQMLCTCLSVVQKGCDVKVIRLNPYPADKDHFGFTFVDYEEMDPIPLTPEILEKCGFDKSGLHCWINRVDEYSLLIIQDNRRFELMDITSGETVLSWDTRVENLHQLQNLFFSLAGLELDVKL